MAKHMPEIQFNMESAKSLPEIQHEQEMGKYESETRKSKTEAVLQRQSMLKLGVICNFMKR